MSYLTDWRLAIAVVVSITLPPVACLVAAAELAPPESAQVERVVDGDTLKVLIGETSETVRIIGIDTPETVHPSKPVECFG